jgi:asparagine synthase (glutamine-hydrolysing)
MYLLFRGLFTRRQIQDLLGIGEHEVTDIAPLFPLESGDTSQPLGVALAFLEFHVYLQSQLLRDADCMGMAHGLEIRVPFLDHRLVEYVLGLPLTLKRCRGMNKPLLVRALGEALPRSIWDRPKQGLRFPLPNGCGNMGRSFRSVRKTRRYLRSVPSRMFGMLFMRADCIGRARGRYSF